LAFTLVSAWGAAKARLGAAGVEGPVIDARLLVEAATGASRADILAEPQRPLNAEQENLLEEYVVRRSAREPISQILGHKGFWKIILGVTADVLTPRPETESLVEAALAAFGPEQPFNLLDLGVGSGAVMLAVLAERPLAHGTGVDASEEALAVARDNAAKLGLRDQATLLLGDWATGLPDAHYDVALSNPPYIPSGEIDGLAPEVRDHEPRLALDGGPDGLAAFRTLAPQIMRVLKPGGIFAVEIAPLQNRAVEALFLETGARALRVVNDLAGRPRVIAGAKKDLGH
jgi:release factor glutamine methyltransferase